MNHCPRDNQKLTAQAASLHNVQKCGGCSGIWLPASAVIELIGKTKRPRSSPDLILQSSIRCPDDGRQLVAITKHGVEIDVCSSCGGVWLDGGELRQLQRSEKSRSKLTDSAADGAVEFAGQTLLEAAFNPASHCGVGRITEGAVEGAIELIGGILDGL